MVLVTLLFCIYMLPLGNILRKHRLGFHFYADSTQLYVSTNTVTANNTALLVSCLQDIKSVDAVEFPEVKLQEGRRSY